MNNYPSRYAEEIKARVPLLDLLAHYGFHPSYNRMACPFHNGQDRNMLVSNNIYKCFVCGEHGDAIAFVQKYFDLDFPSAMAKINEDFRLGLPIGKQLTRAEQTEADKRFADLRLKAKARERKRKRLEQQYNEALEKYCACDTIIMRCAPISPATGFTVPFCWAVKNIDAAWADLKEAEAQLFQLRREENAEGQKSG